VIVADSSALIKYLSREEGWPEVRRHLEGGSITLDLAFKEAFNAIWKRVVMDGLEEDYASKVLASFLKSELVKRVDQERFLREAFAIAVRGKITVYDSLFIALARETGMPLLTSDAKQARAAEKENAKAILA